MDKELDEIDRFVLRARRVEAHSLAADRTKLKELGQFTITGNIALDGAMVVRRALPNEELFESLAARVRPLLLKRESIHYNKLLDAIEERVGGADLPADKETTVRERLAALRREWSRFDTDTANVLGFAVQSSSLDGADATPQVSDTQLAAAWLYGDVVHVDLQGKKSEGQLLPVKERFSAAVMYFSLVADLTLTTLNAVRRLHEMGVIELASQVLDDEVVVGTDELVDEATAFIASVDTPMPDLDLASREAPEGFKQFTVVDLLRMDPTNQVELVFEDEEGQVVVTYEAAVNRRRKVDDRLFWCALIDNVMEIELSFADSGETLANVRLEDVRTHTPSNKTLLAEAVLQQHMVKATSATFVVAGTPFVNFSLPAALEDTPRSLEVKLDTLLDLVLIEQATRVALEPLKGMYGNAARIQLRRARLLWEGRIVRFGPGPLKAAVPTGTIPDLVQVPGGKITVGEVEVPQPGFCLHHPDAFPSSVTPVPGSDPPVDDVVLHVPDGEVFVAWAPDRREVLPGFDLSEASRWELSYLDEDAYLLGS